MKNGEARQQELGEFYSPLSSLLPTEMVHHFDVKVRYACIQASWMGAFS